MLLYLLLISDLCLMFPYEHNEILILCGYVKILMFLIQMIFFVLHISFFYLVKRSLLLSLDDNDVEHFF